MAALSLAGCDAVFGIDRLARHDAGIDAAPVDAAADAAACTRRALSATLLEDTALIASSCGGANRLGKATNLNIGQDGTSRVLLRFSLSPEISAAIADDVVVGGTLKITLRPNDCACTNAPTNFQIYAATDGWNEGNGTDYNGADWCNRIGIASGNQTPWQASGADGSSDRSQYVLGTRNVTAAEVMPPGAIMVPFTVDSQLRAELRARAINNRLSLLLVPTAGGTLFLYSREGLATASTLTIDECR